MEKNTYPNWSVYIQQGGQLKHPGRATKRVQWSSAEEAWQKALRVFELYKGGVDVLVLKYTAPYTATIVHIINRTPAS